jgi:hypothetical protein
MGMLPCTFWPGTRDPYPTGPPTGRPADSGGRHRPATPPTPYENTAELAKMLGTGQGPHLGRARGHTAYPSTKCIVDAVDAYLIDLQVPKEGLRCPPQ